MANIKENFARGNKFGSYSSWKKASWYVRKIPKTY